MWTALALVLVAMSACGPGGAAPISDTGLPPDTQDEFRRTASERVDSTQSVPFGPPELIGRALQLMASDRYLVVTDFKPPYIHVLDAVTGGHIRSFGLQGEGPGDFPGTPYGITGSMRTDTVWFYEMASGRLSGVAVRDLGVDSLRPISATRSVKATTGAMFTINGPDKAGNLLGMTDTRHGIQAVTYSLPGAKLTTRDTLALNDGRMDPYNLGNAYQGILCYVAGKDVWVEFHRNAGWVPIVDSTGAILGELPTPFRWRPHVQESDREPGRMVFSPIVPSVRHAYTACATTDQFVYGLYMGHLAGEDAARHFFDRLPRGEIHVFDMSFNLVKTYVLDHVTGVLAVPLGDSVLFSVSEDSAGPQVRRTRLPR